MKKGRNRKNSFSKFVNPYKKKNKGKNIQKQDRNNKKNKRNGKIEKDFKFEDFLTRITETKEKISYSNLVKIGVLSKKGQGFGFVLPITEEKRKEVLKKYLEKGISLEKLENIFVSIKEEVFVSSEKIRIANDGDIVSVKNLEKAKDGKKSEGDIADIILRSKKPVVGTFRNYSGTFFVIPDDKTFIGDIYILNGRELSAVDGDKVVVEILSYSTGKRNSTRKSC